VRVLPARQQGLDTSQLGTFDETLFVEHPLPPLQEPGVSGTENGVNKHAKATDRIACPRVLPSEHQRDPRPPTPARRRGRASATGKLGRGTAPEVAKEHIYPDVSDREPRTAIHDRTPFAHHRHLPVVTQTTYVSGINHPA
jgi:hypothetical protein